MPLARLLHDFYAGYELFLYLEISQVASISYITHGVLLLRHILQVGNKR